MLESFSPINPSIVFSNPADSCISLALGNSLLTNSTLQTLLLEENSLDAKACICIAASVIENKSIRHLCLSGNPIGEQGAIVLVQTPKYVGSRCHITASRCNISIRDLSIPFNLAKLENSYTLDMENPLERGTLLLLLRFVADHSTFQITQFDVYKSSGVKTFESLTFVQDVETVSFEDLDEGQAIEYQSLNAVIKVLSDIPRAMKKFDEYSGDDGLYLFHR